MPHYVRIPEILNMRISLMPQVPFFFLFLFILIFSTRLLFSQDNAKLQELVDKLNKVVKEIENCGNDLDCINRKSKEMEKIAKEMEEVQKKTSQGQDTKLFNSNINLGQQNKLPPPFDSITDLWLAHIIASTPIPGKPVDCVKINKTRDELLERISKIYEKEKNINSLEWPINISYCNEAKVITEERGKIDVPNGMLLEYKIHTDESPYWIITNEIFLDKDDYRFGNKVNYRLSEASQNAVLVKEYDGWILNLSVDPPVKLPLNNHSILSEKEQEKVWENSFSNSIIYTEILPSMYNSNGEITEYMLQLHFEPTRFYPKGYPEFYVETYSGTVFEKIDREELISASRQGVYNGIFNESGLYSGMDITKKVTITFEPEGCDTSNSAGNGAIVLSGDCIDHGGYVNASSTSFLVHNKSAALIGDEVFCKKHGTTKIIASERVDVLSGDKQIARIGDNTECGATIIGGSKNTYTGIK